MVFFRVIYRKLMARISRNQFVKLQKRYTTDQAIAGLFGLSRQAVHQLRTRYGIAPVADRKKTRNEEIIALHASGISVQKLAKKYELSVTQVYRLVKGVSPVKK